MPRVINDYDSHLFYPPQNGIILTEITINANEINLTLNRFLKMTRDSEK